MRFGAFDLALCIAGLITVLAVIGIIILAALRVPIPSAIEATVIAGVGFWFTKGAAGAIAPPPPPAAPPVEKQP